MYPLVIKVLLSHLLGDFVLQSNKMVAGIHTHKLRSKYLYMHIGIHFIVLWAFLQFQWHYFFSVLLLSLSHLVIDIFTKLFLAGKLKAVATLIIDQILHLITLYIFVNCFYAFKIDWNACFSEANYFLLIALISISFVASVFIKKTMELFQFPKEGMGFAGKYIGILERLFIFFFVATSFWEGIGFLLAAKSIFRFGDLKENKDRKLTEYILIGTLLSFGIAILISVAYLRIRTMIL